MMADVHIMITQNRTTEQNVNVVNVRLEYLHSTPFIIHTIRCSTVFLVFNAAAYTQPE
jgi:hypothetical protein